MLSETLIVTALRNIEAGLCKPADAPAYAKKVLRDYDAHAELVKKAADEASVAVVAAYNADDRSDEEPRIWGMGIREILLRDKGSI